MTTKTTIFIFIALLCGGYFGYANWCQCSWPFLDAPSGATTTDPVATPDPNSEPSTPTTSPSTPEAAVPSEWSTYTTATSSGVTLLLRHPTSTMVTQVQPNIYEFKYVGPNSEANTEITDGFYGSVTLASDRTLDAYLDEQLVIDTPAETNFKGYDAREYRTESALSGRSVPHIAFAVPTDEGKTIVDISYSTMGERQAAYEETVQTILDSMTVADTTTQQGIIVALPASDTTVDSPVRITGRALGTWFFEGSFSVMVVDWDGRIIGESYVAAQEEWMTESYVPFSGQVEYDLSADTPYTRGTIILQKANPSGMPARDATVELRVELVPNAD